MNLMLHAQLANAGSEKSVPIKVADALAADPGERFDVVLANPLKRADLDEFLRLYNPANRHDRRPRWGKGLDSSSSAGMTAKGRWRASSYGELIARDEASLDIFWHKGESLADSGNLPLPEVIAQEIVDYLEAALEQFRLIAGELGGARLDT
jgi:type I restriction enzyme M protein